jgi:hypothetical protein
MYTRSYSKEHNKKKERIWNGTVITLFFSYIVLACKILYCFILTFEGMGIRFNFKLCCFVMILWSVTVYLI